MQFTGVSTLAFADVPGAQMSYANTLFSTATQLAVGLGITLGAIGIRIGEHISGWLGIAAMEGISFRLACINHSHQTDQRNKDKRQPETNPFHRGDP